MRPQRNEHDPRVFFAAERTLLAWIRTALALMGLGFVVARFDVLAAGPSSLLAGTALIAVSVAFILAAVKIYVATVRRLGRGEPFEGHVSPLAMTLAGLLALLEPPWWCGSSPDDTRGQFAAPVKSWQRAPSARQ
jgi:putative membrane protein